MRLTPRRRAAIAILVTWPFAYFYVSWAAFTAINIFRDARSGYVGCDGTWRSYFNSCDPTNYSSTLALGELAVSAAVVCTLVYLLARWVVQPIRDVARTVGRFGPTSLGLRLRADGPGDETRLLSDEIDAMLDRLAEGYEAQRRFASTASHELRTPLATQRALIEVSLASALTPEQLELLSRQLLATNERNEQLVDGLLTLAETDRGLLSNTAQRLDEVVAEALESLRPAARDRDVQLTSSLEPAVVSGERPLLERLATNLVFNGIRHNYPGGSVAVAVTPGCFVVTNTGPVVPPELMSGLFEPFRRGSGERLDHGGGVGLGLTIARSIVAAHGAEIRAVPNPSGGLRVEVRFHPAG